MNPEQLYQMVQWLNKQIMSMDESIKSSHQENNYVKKAQFEGMRDAFMKCLSKLNNLAAEDIKPKIINKPLKKQLFKNITP